MKKIISSLVIIVAAVWVVAVGLKFFASMEDTGVSSNNDTLEEIHEIKDITTNDESEASEGTRVTDTGENQSNGEEVVETAENDEVTGSAETENGATSDGSIEDASDTTNPEVLEGSETDTTVENEGSTDEVIVISNENGDTSDTQSNLYTDPSFLSIIGEFSYNYTDGVTEEVVNPESIYVLANKKNSLPSDYTPSDLVVPEVAFSFSGESDKRKLRADAAEALALLFDDAKTAGYDLFAVSGYRAYSTQKSIYNNFVNTYGEEEANTFSAKPGTSEHQTGLAMDISCAEVGYALKTRFGEIPEGIWVAEHAHEYGFIIRYPEGKEDITGYQYEPWHLRYIGTEIAGYIYENQITLDQFYEGLENN